MKNLAELWCSLLLAKTAEEQAAWARAHGLQLIDHVCLTTGADLGDIELALSPEEALARYAEANPRHPLPFEQA